MNRAVPLIHRNGLWHLEHELNAQHVTSTSFHTNKLNSQQESELWSFRLDSLGETQLCEIHHHTDGVPRLKFYPFLSITSSQDANIKKVAS